MLNYGGLDHQSKEFEKNCFLPMVWFSEAEKNWPGALEGRKGGSNSLEVMAEVLPSCHSLLK